MKHLIIIASILIINGWTITVESQKATNVLTLKNQRKVIEKEIAITDSLLKAGRQTEKTSLEQISLIESQINNQNEIIQTIQQEVNIVNNQLQTTGKRIDNLQSQLTINQKEYEKAIIKINGSTKRENNLIFLLSGENIRQVYKRFLYLKHYSTAHKEMGTAIKTKKDSIEQEKQTIQAQQKEKETLLNQYNQEAQQLHTTENQYKTELKTLQSNQQTYQAELNEKKEKMRKFDQEIDRIIQQEIDTRKEEQQTTNKNKKPINNKPTENISETTTKAFENQTTETEIENRKITPPIPQNSNRTTEKLATITTIDQATTAAFAKKRGSLPYPVSKNGVMVNGVERQRDGKTNRMIITNSNVYIRVPANTEARAIHDGKISSIVYYDGGNYTVLIRHGSYITAYGNLSSVTVKQGQKVTSKQHIGKIFTPQGQNTTELHFQIRNETTRLDPALWITRNQ